MDMQTAVTAIIIILLVVVPFYIHHFFQRKKEKKSFAQLEAAARQQGYRITRKQVFLQSAIGLDEKAGILFFMHHHALQPQLQQLPLEGLRECRVVTTKDSSSVLHDVPGKVELLLGFNKKAEKEERLLFYNRTEKGAALSDEILEARKWASLIIDRYVN